MRGETLPAVVGLEEKRAWKVPVSRRMGYSPLPAASWVQNQFIFNNV